MVEVTIVQKVLSTPSPAPISPHLELRPTPFAGRSLFATAPLEAGYVVHTSLPPAISTVIDIFKREVCWTCFAEVERGRWKVKESMVDGKPEGEGVRWFCSEGCLQEWREKVGEDGVDAVRAGERALAKAVSTKGRKGTAVEDEAAGDQKEDPLERSVLETIWGKALRDGQDLLKRRKKAEESGRWRPQDILIPSDDPDVFRLLIDGITLKHQSDAVPSTCRITYKAPRSTTWANVESLAPTLSLTSGSADSLVRMYHSLLAILPSSLLHQTTPTTILTIISRDLGNAFGCWSSPNLPPQPDPNEDQERGHLIAYGLFPSSSYFNHSCTPNLSKRRVRNRYEFKVGPRGIAEGEEVCISYLGGGEKASRDERRQKLFDGWGFWCACRRCDEEAEGDVKEQPGKSASVS
ncbi:SET domain-containing protein [Meredithblackwellia eburnea MCA 4105]